MTAQNTSIAQSILDNQDGEALDEQLFFMEDEELNELRTTYAELPKQWENKQFKRKFNEQQPPEEKPADVAFAEIIVARANNLLVERQS